MSPLLVSPKRRAGFHAVSSAIRCSARPRRRPSLKTPDKRYSVPPNPDFAGQMSSSGRRAPLTSLAQHAWSRSEEHTSELQSLTNLVCRLLLEKKKKIRSLYLE